MYLHDIRQALDLPYLNVRATTFFISGSISDSASYFVAARTNDIPE
jgi:hypothetical protein